MSTNSEYVSIADSTGISMDTNYIPSVTNTSMQGNISTPLGGNYGINPPIYQPYPNYINYPNVVVNTGAYGFISPTEPVKYTIYKLVYKLSHTTSEKELVFAYQSDEAPELGIMKAADKINLKFIEILSLQELETSEVFLLSTQKVKEIEL